MDASAMNKNGIILFFLAILAAGSNCTLEPFNGGSDTMVTEEDLESATLILGDALSDESGGIFLSVQDAINIITGNSIYPKANPQQDETGDNPRAKLVFQSNYTTSYNEKTGTHIITFQRWSEDELSTEHDSLNYIYRDINGDFIAWPSDSSMDVESISFEGFKEGRHQESRGMFNEDGFYESEPIKTNVYSQRSAFLITGLSARNNVYPIEGSHTTQGFVQYFEKDKTNLNRYFELEMDLLNVTVHAEPVICEEVRRTPDMAVGCGQKAKTDFEGEAVLEMKTWNNPEKRDTPVSFSGMVQFNGDGTATINFRESDTPVSIKTSTERERSTEIEVNKENPADSDNNNG